jgi:uncharacterized membrane protein HdeD (DUF308 family)
MKKTVLIISWCFYILGVFSLIFALTNKMEIDLNLTLISGTLIIIPWIICIYSLIKGKAENKLLWLYTLLFFGIISTPIYLTRIWQEKQNDCLILPEDYFEKTKRD